MKVSNKLQEFQAIANIEWKNISHFFHVFFTPSVCPFSYSNLATNLSR
jgi:hypothetical protein